MKVKIATTDNGTRIVQLDRRPEPPISVIHFHPRHGQYFTVNEEATPHELLVANLALQADTHQLAERTAQASEQTAEWLRGS